MINVIWVGMIVLSLFCAVFTGKVEQLSLSAAEGADKAVNLLISMTGSMCLWCGLMKIADRSGATKLLSGALSPVIARLMPDVKKDSAAMGAVSANITANFLGLGNAATPLGIIAIKELNKINRLNDEPSASMIIFVVINTASVQLIPATIAALRQAAGSTSPYSILPYVWISSALALIGGLCVTKFMQTKRAFRRCSYG